MISTLFPAIGWTLNTGKYKDCIILITPCPAPLHVILAALHQGPCNEGLNTPLKGLLLGHFHRVFLGILVTGISLSKVQEGNKQ